MFQIIQGTLEYFFIVTFTLTFYPNCFGEIFYGRLFRMIHDRDFFVAFHVKRVSESWRGITSKETEVYTIYSYFALTN